jgi:hypothetical protein
MQADGRKLLVEFAAILLPCQITTNTRQGYFAKVRLYLGDVQQAIAKLEECDGYEQKELQRLKEMIGDELVS